MNYQIAICDDNKSDIEYILSLTKEWANEFGVLINVDIFYSAESFLFNYAENNAYDILLLDIEMGKMDGVSLAKILRNENETIQIIFITGYTDYISEGYDVSALHYLIKPVKKGKLFSVFERAVNKIKKNEKILNLEINNEMMRIPIRQIKYSSVMGNYVTIYAKDIYTIRMTLGELEKNLDERFYRAGRSVIVNLTNINRVTKTQIKLNDGTIIPLPRGAYGKINRAIINMR